MGKLRQTALILGEGPTEFFYFKSLCDVFKRLTIKPDYPKHTNIKELNAKIAEGVEMGYNHIFCIIDMDTNSPLHRTVFPILFPLHLTSIQYTRAIAQRPESMCGVSENDRILHQDQRTSRLLRAQWWQSR